MSARAQGLANSAYPSLPLSELPPPPAYYRHRVLPKQIPDRKPLEFSVRSRRDQRRTSRNSIVLGRTKPEEKAQKTATQARPMNEHVNPLPLLLSDDTLRRGDVVMFPDGPRVFIGQQGDDHRISDFEKVVTAAKNLSKSARVSLTRFKAGVNEAWDTKVLGRTGSAKDRVYRNPYKEKITPPDGGPRESFTPRRAQIRSGNAELGG